MAGEETTTQSDSQSAPERIDRLFMENNLLRVVGVLFCHDKRTASTHTSTLTTIEELVKRPITIEPHPDYGQPGPGHFKVFMAILKKLSDYGRPVPNKVYFSRAELARLVDRSWSGNANKQLVRFLYGLAHTRVSTSFYDRTQDTWQLANFSIPSEFILSGKGSKLQSCAVTIPEVIQRSLEDRFFSCLNFARIRGASTIEAALYIRLWHHFSNLHEHGTRNAVQVRKRYDAICQEWLGGLTVLHHRSKIIREQLGPHLDRLVASKFLRSYGIEKTAKGDGFNITFLPGRAFFEEYDAVYKRRTQPEIQFQFHEEEAEIGHPIELVRRFHELRTGQKITAAHITPAEQAYATTLIGELGYDAAMAFVDYGVARADASGYAVNALSGLKIYVADFLGTRAARERARQRAANRDKERREETDRAAYAAFCERQAEEFLAAAPAVVATEIESDAIAKVRSRGGMFARMAGPLAIRIERMALVQERLQLPSFEDWRKDLQQAS
jgi:hypothetical protein